MNILGAKERADTALVRRGLCQSREKAQALIMAGEVYVGVKKIRKSSDQVSTEDVLTLRQVSDQYVSRGAYKLEKAIKVFQADIKGHVIMDIGASTGGFTDVCLKNGASHVYAIDVGYGQLDWKLRNNPRVTVMERVNARYLTKDLFPVLPDIAVMDVSFISVRLILPAAFEVLGPGGIMYSLIKPQFEAGKEKVGKNGVVRDPETHIDVLRSIVEFAESNSLHIRRIDYSPITGPEGNIEFLSEIVPGTGDAEIISKSEIENIVYQAHDHLSVRGMKI